MTNIVWGVKIFRLANIDLLIEISTKRDEYMENPFKELARLIKKAQDYVGKDKSEEVKRLNSNLRS